MKENDCSDRILAEEQQIDGKKVDCKLAVPREQNANAETTDTFRTKKIFVGGLPPDVTQEVFIQFFGQFGPIEDSIVMFDRETGRPRGFGFITFVSEDSVEKVIENNESNYINGKWVECKKAMPRYTQNEGYEYKNQQYYNQPYVPQYQYQNYSMYPQQFMVYPNYYNQNYYEAGNYGEFYQTNQYETEQQHSEEQLKQRFIDDLLNEEAANPQRYDLYRDDHRGKTFN